MKKSTYANLEAAFAGESQAFMKYSIFADKAEREGFKEIARLFKAIAFAEKVHATNHFRALGKINDTVANLEVAIGGENYEVTEMYPAFDAVAKLQEEKAATRSIHYALEAEKIHEVMYGDAKKSVEAGKDIPEANVYICPTCGHTVIGEAPDECPVCGVKKDKFIKF
ncbi:MAG: rubrerythrin family protein [Ignavibacteriales bacterium]|nr:rubrerythrin family protein [Ignavibacteriales bacterium]